MDDELIQFKGVTKRFGKNVVLDSIDLTIPEGKITGIIGASGEGKSTILKLIASFYKPNKGNIFYLRRKITKDRRHVKKIFGFAIEDGSFYEQLTVRENLYHFGKLYDVPRKILKQRVKEILDLVGLEDASKTLADNLSLGMKKRLDLACAMVHNPSVLILDEPTADLDPLLRNQMLHLIKKINSHGTTIILTTQIINETDEICDRVAVLFNEKITDETTPSKLKAKYKSRDMDDVFNKIFSKKNRKTYQESKEKKTKLDLLDKNAPKKKTLMKDESKIREILDKMDKKNDGSGGYFSEEEMKIGKNSGGKK